MQYLPLAVALLASPSTDDVQQELMDARQELQQFQETDLQPLAGLVTKAKAAAPKQQFPGIPYPSSLLQEPTKRDPDAVDKDGKTLEDKTLEKEESNINALRSSFNKEWKDLGDSWDADDKKEGIGKYRKDMPKITVPKAEPEGVPASLAQIDAHHKAHAHHRAYAQKSNVHKARAPIMGDRDALSRSAGDLAQFVHDQRDQLKQLFPSMPTDPSSFAETEPRSEQDLTGLAHVSEKLKGIEDRLRAQVKNLKEAEAMESHGAPSSFMQTDGDMTNVDFKKIKESLKQLRAHVAKQQDELKMKGFFDTAPTVDDDEPMSFAQTDNAHVDVAAVKKEVSGIIADLKTRAARSKAHAHHLHDAEQQLTKIQEAAGADAVHAKAELAKFPRLVAEQAAERKRLKAKDAKVDDADPSSFLQTDDSKAPTINWFDEDRKDDFDAKQAAMDQDEKRLAGTVERMQKAHLALEKDLAATQAHEKTHKHSKIYAKLRDIALGKAKPDHPQNELDLRTDEAA